MAYRRALAMNPNEMVGEGRMWNHALNLRHMTRDTICCRVDRTAWQMLIPAGVDVSHFFPAYVFL